MATTYNPEYYQQNKARMDAAGKRHYQAVRAAVIEAYGGKCACCGESTPEFLGVDHIFNDGAYDRKVLKMSGYTLYRKLRRDGYPKDRFQLLCHNCNQAKGYYKICPHQKMRTEIYGLISLLLAARGPEKRSGG